ncbi:baseplate assembly protein [Sphingobium sp. AR-3-1]|uniref:Baseplate assembly protein n=2 Tax=Sphingobium psychrophilum TaxID=2728834 RepID=A0A7X9WRR9_9SPHN|nr:baseplate assembly protein [Sphingobium psychrophilum]
MSVAVDLSRLPSPQVVETLSYDIIKADMLALFQQLMVEAELPFDALVESDPVMKLIEAWAYRELLIRQNFNERAVSMLIAKATGADLENLGAFYGVTRLNGESDDRLRRRILLAPDAFTVAGPEAAYVFHALSADVSIADAVATSPAPGQVLVSLLSESGDGTATPAQIAAVVAALGDDVRPLTDYVTVASATRVDFQIAAALSIAGGPDPAIVLQAANADLETYKDQRRRIGRMVARAGLIGSLQVEGVENTNLTLPAADVDPGRTGFANVTATSVTVAA